MAPILSLTKERMDSIKDATHLSLVAVWQDAASSGIRVGFVTQCFRNKCAVITVRQGLQVNRKVYVRFGNGDTFEGSVYFGGDSKDSRLAAIIVRNLSFTPNIMGWSAVEAKQCDPVVHFGFFDNECNILGLSSGSVGLVCHNPPTPEKEKYTTFAHCCSENKYAMGAPVCNLSGEGVGINMSKIEDKNLFFAMDRSQMCREMMILFGPDKMGLIQALGMGKPPARGVAERDLGKGKKRKMA